MKRAAVAFALVGVAWFAPLDARQCLTGVMSRGLQPGDTAPDFELPGTDGRTYRLADYRGKQAVILAWFAKANSDG
jgi:peroxiredoxin Q/BCP